MHPCKRFHYNQSMQITILDYTGNLLAIIHISTATSDSVQGYVSYSIKVIIVEYYINMGLLVRQNLDVVMSNLSVIRFNCNPLKSRFIINSFSIDKLHFSRIW